MNKIIAKTLLLSSLSFGAQAASLNSGFGSNTLGPTDESSSTAIDISSVFSNGLDFFGTTYNSLYVNNNGTVSFNNSLSSFSPSEITAISSTPYLAAFSADIDTSMGPATATDGGNSTGSNLVYWDMNASAGTFTATWDDVAYYSFDGDTSLLNAFQIVITDRTDRGLGDFDIEYRYEALNWTTGDFSDGFMGLGGMVARAGWTAGNGSDFFELDASGNQEAMLNLVNTSNVGEAGVYQFEVRNGGPVPDMPRIPVPASAFLFAPALLGFVGLRRKATKLAA